MAQLTYPGSDRRKVYSRTCLGNGNKPEEALGVKSDHSKLQKKDLYNMANEVHLT
jgi:hypothetical protein